MRQTGRTDNQAWILDISLTLDPLNVHCAQTSALILRRYSQRSAQAGAPSHAGEGELQRALERAGGRRAPTSA